MNLQESIRRILKEDYNQDKKIFDLSLKHLPKKNFIDVLRYVDGDDESFDVLVFDLTLLGFNSDYKEMRRIGDLIEIATLISFYVSDISGDDYDNYYELSIDFIIEKMKEKNINKIYISKNNSGSKYNTELIKKLNEYGIDVIPF